MNLLSHSLFLLCRLYSGSLKGMLPDVKWFFSLLLVFVRVTYGAFTFVLHINSHTTHVSCDTVLFSECETYFSVFCLRESRPGRSTDQSDCPLGINHVDFHENSGTIQVQSSMAWQESFQLFMVALDQDPASADDYIDDIFIEGSLRNNSLSSPMVFTGQLRRVTMTVQFQRVCDTDFYGVDCLTSCVASDDDVTGHYTCDSETGSRICLPGYTNPSNNCRENIDDCASRPCQNGGNCTDLVTDFSCDCPEGYSGKTCSLDIDDCQEVDCPGNSTCVDSVGAFMCVCNPGFTGYNCSTPILDPCESGLCVNGGTCVAVDSSTSMCVCPAGYTGPVCELNIDNCLNASCPQGTSCVNGKNTFLCVSSDSDDKIENPSNQRKSAGTVNIVMVGSIVGVAVVIVLGCFILVVVLLIVGMKRKNRKITRRYSENAYTSSPSKREELECNPLYGAPDSSVFSLPTSPLGSVHECENSLYNMADLRQRPSGIDEEEIQQTEGAIYEQPDMATTAMIQTSPNKSYDSINLNFQGGKEMKNPLYGTGVSPSSPTYSVPRPSNSSLPSTSGSNPLPDEHPGHETPAMDVSNGEVFYETVDQNSPHLKYQVISVLESSSVEAYNQLDHHLQSMKPSRLPDTNQHGYGQLGHS